MITNHGYLDGPLFRDMRKELLDTFSKIYILQLHGDSRVGEIAPNGEKDENVFDIQQGVAIAFFIKDTNKSKKAVVFHSDIWGSQENKYNILAESDINTTKWEKLSPEPRYYNFTPFNKKLNKEYENCIPLTTIFGTGNPKKDAHISYGAGFVTQQDQFAIGFDTNTLINNITTFLDINKTKDELQAKFHFCTTNQWNFEKARKELNDININDVLKKCLYRPFDYRFTVLNKNVATILRTAIMRNLDKKNLALLTTRRVTHLPFNNFLVTNCIVEYKAVSHDRNTMVFPLYIYPTSNKEKIDKSGGKEGGIQSAMALQEKHESNFNPIIIKTVTEKLGLIFIEEGKGDLKKTYSQEDFFNYIYAVFYSPTYRTRYGEFLKIDFPRLPLTSDKALFKKLAEKGAELVSLHLMESPILDKLITGYPVKGDNKVEKVTYLEKDEQVKINDTQYFEGVTPEVWNFHIGGYQVCEKWLKDRKGRTLTYDELTHYQKVVVALKETIRLMAEIDKIIPFWPIT